MPSFPPEPQPVDGELAAQRPAVAEPPIPTPVYCSANVFGLKEVVWLPERNEFRLLHGRVEHGRQSRDPAKALIPLGYFHRSGPLGDAMRALGEQGDIAVIGLGVGAAAAYCAPGQKMLFFEIDNEVERIAKKHFSYLQDSAGDLEVRVGDGLACLRAAQDREFSLLLVDAYDSSEVPEHFLSAEAFAVYLARLAPAGAVILAATHGQDAVLPAIAARAQALQLALLTRLEVVSATEETWGDRQTSRYVAVARKAEHLAELARRPGWTCPDGH